MSYTFSRALVAAFSAANCSDTVASAPSRSTPIVDQYWWPDKTTGHSRLSRFGTTSEPLTGIDGEALLTWCVEDSRARTSALPVAAPASTASAADSGWKWHGSFAKYDPATSSWRTRQHSLLGGLDEFSETWPRWGSMRSGESLARQTLVPITDANESGSWPTPTAMDSEQAGGLGCIASGKRGLSLHQAAKLIPTPTAGDAKSSGSRNTANSNAHPGTSLTDSVREDGGTGRQWPTPASRDYRHPNAISYQERSGTTKGEQLPNAVGGALNPTWVEWLMAWPLGWTDLKPLETDKFREWQQQHGDC